MLNLFNINLTFYLILIINSLILITLDSIIYIIGRYKVLTM